ncbi:hypothetical protein CTATCC11996_20544 [Comamonas testosteroni ATCC 11996]|nr:hypothetical protein CTATCC11996_20544 [Comamonas testosteroni ATCC 11996]
MVGKDLACLPAWNKRCCRGLAVHSIAFSKTRCGLAFLA